MRELQHSTNHCPRIAPSLLMALAVVFSGIASAQSANGAGEHQLEHVAADSIRDKITRNWLRPTDLPGVNAVHVKVRMKLDRDGKIMGQPEVVARGGPEKTQKIVAASAVRAVLRAAPFTGLPRAQFDNETSSVEVILNFEPGDMAL